jgi:hypothetical protein
VVGVLNGQSADALRPLAGRAIGKVQIGDQSQDREGARPGVPLALQVAADEVIE